MSQVEEKILRVSEGDHRPRSKEDVREVTGARRASRGSAQVVAKEQRAHEVLMN